MTNYDSHIGLHLYNSRLQIAEVDCSLKQNVNVCNIDEEYFTDFISSSDKETKILTILQSAYDELIYRKPLKAFYASFLLPMNFYNISEIPFEKSLFKNDLLDYYKWNIKALYPHLDTTSLLVQNFIVNNPKTACKTVAIVTLQNKIAKLIHKFCSRNNLVLKYIDNPHIVSHSLISSAYPSETITTFFVTDNITSIIISRNSEIFYFSLKSFNNLNDIKNILGEHKNSLELNIISDFVRINNTYIVGDLISDSLLSQFTNVFGFTPKLYNPLENITFSHTPIIEKFSVRINSFIPSVSLASRLV